MSRRLKDLMLEKWDSLSEDERKAWTMRRGLFPELCEILKPREDETCAEGAARVVAERDRYREALEKIVSVNVNPKAEVGRYLQAIAIAALKGE